MIIKLFPLLLPLRLLTPLQHSNIGDDDDDDHEDIGNDDDNNNDIDVDEGNMNKLFFKKVNG